MCIRFCFHIILYVLEAEEDTHVLILIYDKVTYQRENIFSNISGTKAGSDHIYYYVLF